MPAHPARDHEQQILAAFGGTFPPVAVGGFYKLGMLLVTLAMVVLPLVYVSLVAAVGWLLYRHAVGNLSLFNEMRKGAVTAYVVPLVVLAILFFFMIKPLFAPRGRQPVHRALVPDREPVLFAFVQRICELVRAPVPREIRVDCNVNASASFRRGVWSMFGNDLTLTIGLPLVSGLPLRHFAGVLAHEFGHFAQGGGMRLTYLVRSVDAWFARVVYERDAWDERLVEWSQGDIDFRLRIPLYLARGCVWVTRRILWALMMAGHAISCFMLRQMEYDADRYEARLAGSAAFEESMRRLPLLAAAHNGAASRLFGHDWKEGRLVDNFMAFSLVVGEQMPDAVRQKVNGGVDTETTGWFDTHPAARDRIASAHAENAGGVLVTDRPATELFTDFDQTAREVTRDWYDQLLGEEKEKARIVPVGHLLAKQREAEAEGKAAARWFQGTVSALRPLPPMTEPAAQPPPLTPEEAAAAIRDAREQMLAALPAYRETFRTYDDADTRRLKALQAGALLRAGLRIAAADFKYPDGKLETVKAAREDADARLRTLAADLASMEQTHAVRIAAVRRLAHAPFVEEDTGGDPERKSVREELDRVLAVHAALTRIMPDFQKLREEFTVLGVLLANFENGRTIEAYMEATRGAVHEVHRLLAEIRRNLGDTPYPFRHERGAMSMNRYLLERLPEKDEVGEICGAAEQLLRQTGAVHFRLLARVAFLAEQLEAAVGVDALPEPPEAPAAEPAEADAAE